MLRGSGWVFVRVRVLFGDALRRRVGEVLFLVDTGSFFPIIPLGLARGYGLEALAEVELLLADGRRVRAGVSLAYFRVLDRDGVFQVALMDSPEPILGVIVLEGLGVKDPVTSKLEYSRPYGLAALSSHPPRRPA
jgi:predicted aspartyl protease